VTEETTSCFSACHHAAAPAARVCAWRGGEGRGGTACKRHQIAITTDV
jgi:hypothetical protein